MKHGPTAYMVSYDELARRLESVGETLLSDYSDGAAAAAGMAANQSETRDRHIFARPMDPVERERLGRRLLDRARRMRADATRPGPDRAQST